MGKGEIKLDGVFQTSPDFNARMDRQVKDILIDISKECFRVGKENGQPQIACLMNTYPVLLQVIAKLIEAQHRAMIFTVCESKDTSKGPVG